jgi:hypothetical protein
MNGEVEEEFIMSGSDPSSERSFEGYGLQPVHQGQQNWQGL